MYWECREAVNIEPTAKSAPPTLWSGDDSTFRGTKMKSLEKFLRVDNIGV